MSRRRASGILSLDYSAVGDLYVYLEPHEARRGRPPKHDLARWSVVDDWPSDVPVTAAEVDLFGAWFGDILDELFGPGGEE